MPRLSAMIATVVVAVLAGCGETPQHAQYEDGRYAGKPDSPPWEGQAFGNDRAKWEKEILRRNKQQSEYTRQGGA